MARKAATAEVEIDVVEEVREADQMKWSRDVIMMDVPLDWIEEDPANERADAGVDLDELVASIRERGVLEPLRLYALEGVHPPEDGKYRISSGHRRYRAALALGLGTVPAVIVPRRRSELDASLDRLVSNLQRADLTPMERARGFRAVLDANPELTQEELGRMLGLAQPTIANSLRLLDLPGEVITLVEEGSLPAGGALQLLRVQEDALGWDGNVTDTALVVRIKIAEQAAGYGYSVREITRAVDNHLSGQQQARNYVAQRRKEREELLKREQEAATAPDGTEKSPKQIEQERQKRRDTEEQARKGRREVASGVVLRAAQIDPKGPSIEHLRIVAITINASSAYDHDGREMWGLPTDHKATQSQIEACESKGELMDIIVRLALTNVRPDYDGHKLADFREAAVYANKAWNINEAIHEALKEAGLAEGPEGKGR